MKEQRPREGPQTTDRMPYEAPSLTAYGEVRKVTAGMSAGTVLDETFPTGTPFDDLTFS